MLTRTRPPQRRARERKARALVDEIRRELKQELADLRPLITAAKEKPLSEKKGAVIGRAAGEAYRPLKRSGNRALTNVRKYPFTVELAITGDGSRLRRAVWRSVQTLNKLLTKDEAQRIAADIVKLPGILSKTRYAEL